MKAKSDGIEDQYKLLKRILKSMGNVLVAYSGGVDSTFLLQVAKEALGDNVLAVTARSVTTSAADREDAVRLVRYLGVRHLWVDTFEMDLPAFVKNPKDKCYICKKSRFGELVKLARAHGIETVADGQNTDDLADYRPGMRATEELGIRSPLCEAGFGKADIRRFSKKLNLPTWDKPSAACLASRIPYYQKITAEKLKQVEDAELFLRKLNLSMQIRVRHEGHTARIELAADAIPKIIEKDVRKRVIAHFNALGFRFVALDLEGYSMGSLNRALSRPAKKSEAQKGRF